MTAVAKAFFINNHHNMDYSMDTDKDMDMDMGTGKDSKAVYIHNLEKNLEVPRQNFLKMVLQSHQ